MVELASYGLIGLTAVLAAAFCFACSIEPPSSRKKPSCDLINKRNRRVSASERCPVTHIDCGVQPYAQVCAGG
jgi:hypothetical protein